jgi:hypothetical protein
MGCYHLHSFLSRWYTYLLISFWVFLKSVSLRVMSALEKFCEQENKYQNASDAQADKDRGVGFQSGLNSGTRQHGPFLCMRIHFSESYLTLSQ